MVKPIKSTTLAGTLQANQQVTLKNSILPELYRTCKIKEIEALVFNTHCHYDVILGHDALMTIGLKINFDSHKISWDDSHLTMREYTGSRNFVNIPIDKQEPDLADQLFQELYEEDLEPDDYWPDFLESDDDNNINTDFDINEND